MEKFEELIEKYRPLILSVLFKYNYREYGLASDDLLQEVRIRLWQACRHDIDRRKIGAYIRKIVDSVAIDQLKKMRRELEASNAYSERRTPPANDEILDTIRECLRSLRDSRRKVVTMALLGFSVPEVAKMMNWTNGKTYNLHTRGMGELRKKLKERGFLNERRS